MHILQSHGATVLEEWAMAIALVPATFLFATATRLILERLHKNQGWQIVKQLAPPLSNICYVIGLRVFAEIVPLDGKLDRWLDGLTCVLTVAIFATLVRRAALLTLEWGALRTHRSDVLQQGFLPLTRNLITLFVFLSGGITLLKYFNYDVMSLVTALGVSSLAVGLAAKDTLSNMVSGFILIIDRNVRPGDRINLTGSIGDIKEIGLRSTQILMTDGNTLIVPNSELVNTKILNLSLPTRATACTLSIRVPFSVSFSKLKEICFLVLRQVPRISKEKTGWVNLISLADGYQLVQVGFWISEMNDTGSIVSECNERILATFQNEKISLVTYLDLNIQQASEKIVRRTDTLK